MLPYTDILNHLDHTRFCSGQDLANAFGVTRATIHNCIQRLITMGVAVDCVRGKGYRLSRPLDLLNQGVIETALAPFVQNMLSSFEVVQELDSTNHYIGNLELPKEGHFSAVITEMQTAGKGRRGRHWESPYAANIYMSLLWPLKKSLSEVGALSPLISISIVHALQELTVSGLGLKWPNDIYCQNKKLAGLLIECSGEVNANSKMIIGIGINVRMSEQDSVGIDQAWTDVVSNTSKNDITRNEVAASVLNAIVPAITKFERGYNNDVANEWSQWDIFKDQHVELHFENHDIQGIARGIDDQGFLLLEVKGKLQRISAGDVSLRAQC